MTKRTKSWVKVGAVVVAVVVGWDLYKAHTGLPAPTVNAGRIKA